MTQLTPQKPNASGQVGVNHGVLLDTVHLNVAFEGLLSLMVWQVICTMLKHPRGKGEWEHSLKDLQYVQLHIPPGWRVVKIQWEISGKECYGFMHVRYHLSESGEDIQAVIYNEEARACKWGFHVCGFLFSTSSHLFSPSVSTFAQVLRGEMFLWTTGTQEFTSSYLTMVFIHLSKTLYVFTPVISNIRLFLINHDFLVTKLAHNVTIFYFPWLQSFLNLNHTHYLRICRIKQYPHRCMLEYTVSQSPSQEEEGRRFCGKPLSLFISWASHFLQGMICNFQPQPEAAISGHLLKDCPLFPLHHRLQSLIHLRDLEEQSSTGQKKCNSPI